VATGLVYVNLLVENINDFKFNWAPRHEGVLGSDVMAPHILDIGTRGM
jgi:hypothetical protein